MDTDQIRSEVERLAPWYYAFDLQGVRTDDLPPCDHCGFRVIHFPLVRDGYWRGKRVLDVGCNEGAWTFGVLDQGAAHVDAFDVREVNIEKARFVAGLRGYDKAEFVLGDCDTWFDERPEPYDHIIFPGVLYHLVEPWRTVATFCGKARESILVATALWGGDTIGYTQYEELDNIAASKDSLPSMMPNNTDTVIAEFRKHGFHPTHIYETRESSFWGGTTMLMKNCSAWPDFEPLARAEQPEELDVHLTPDTPLDPAGRQHPVDVEVAIYNRTQAARPVRAALRVLTADGQPVPGGEIGDQFVLQGRVWDKNDPMSLSQYVRVPLDLPTPVAQVEIVVHDANTGAELRRSRARLGTTRR